MIFLANKPVKNRLSQLLIKKKVNKKNKNKINTK